MNTSFWSHVRQNIIGDNKTIDTPFGNRNVLYTDYTASGRGVRFIERYVEELLELYGNTHTEDDTTGEVTTKRLELAEAMIKRFVNAGDDYKLIAVGSGTTGAVHRLQQILGIYIPPVAKEIFEKIGLDPTAVTDEFVDLHKHNIKDNYNEDNNRI